MKNHGGGSAIYGIGILGALVYFIQHAHSFGVGVVGIIYSFFWPGVFVYKVLEMWKM